MKNLTTGNPLKLIFFFALPLMFGNLLQQLYIMVDTMIVGRFVGVDALASIGGADWINWAILGLLMGFTQGFSIRVSNCLGANDERGMEKSIAMSYLSCFFIALICSSMNAFANSSLVIRIIFSGLLLFVIVVTFLFYFV